MSTKMKAVYVDMVVLVCLIQILIGSSYGLPSTLLGNQSRDNTPSTTSAAVNITITFTIPLIAEKGTTIETNTTTEDEIQNTLIHLTISDPYCPPKYCLSNTTLKCEKKYEWMDYTPGLINDTRFVKQRKFLYGIHPIARVVYENGDILPCKVVLNDNGDILILDCNASGAQKLEVLSINCGDYAWIGSSDGTVPNDVIEGGKKGNETIYICRSKHHFGWLQPTKDSCFLPEVEQHHSIDELLIHKI